MDKSSKNLLYDNHGRPISYMRLAVTDRCNLRCFYCMPENGIKYLNRKDLLTFEEMERLTRLFSLYGVDKVRITGGEPFVRKGIMEFIESLSDIPTLSKINITTNGTNTIDKIDKLESLGIHSINLSLDSLNKERFHEITRRDFFDDVMKTLHALIDSDIHAKINMVVMKNRNIDDIYPMLELTRDNDIQVRFIEEMPFNGTPGQGNETHWPMAQILSHVEERYDIHKMIDPPNSTSSNYQIDGYTGSFGIIAAYTRTFCGSCNRIRLTPQGTLKTCLYDDGVLNFRDILRDGASDEELINHLQSAIGNRAKDGFEAEKRRDKGKAVSESMATIGG